MSGFIKDPMSATGLARGGATNVNAPPGGKMLLNPLGQPGGGMPQQAQAQPQAPTLTPAIQPALPNAPPHLAPAVKTAFAVAFAKQAGDRLTPALCKTAAAVLPACDERDDLETLAKAAEEKQALIREGKTIGQGLWNAVRKPGLEMLGGALGGGMVGAGADTLTGLGGMDTNFATYGALGGAAARAPGVRGMLRSIQGNTAPSQMNWMQRAARGTQQAINNVHDTWHIPGGGGTQKNWDTIGSYLSNPISGPTKFTDAVAAVPKNFNPLTRAFWDPSVGWSNLSTSQKAMRGLTAAGIYGGAAGEAGQAVLGYNPLNPRSAGEHFANQRADQMAQQLGFGSYQEAVNSPMGQALAGWNTGGVGGALSGFVGAMSPEQRAMGVGGLGALAGLGAYASGNPLLGLGLGLGGAAAGYGMMPGNGFQQLPSEMNRLGGQFQQLRSNGYNALQAARA